MIDEKSNSKKKDSLPEENESTENQADAGLTKEDGINAFRAVQDQKHRPEDILYHDPDDIDNPEDIVSG